MMKFKKKIELIWSMNNMKAIHTTYIFFWCPISKFLIKKAMTASSNSPFTYFMPVADLRGGGAHFNFQNKVNTPSGKEKEQFFSLN